MALNTGQVILPNDVALAIVKKAEGSSTIARLSPADTVNGWADSKYNIFSETPEAELVAEGAKKSGYETTLTAVEGKRFTVQTTTRVTKQLQWADEADQLQILDAIQAAQAEKLARALDLVIYHGVNPRTGEKADGFTPLSETAHAVTPNAKGDYTADIDALADAVIDWNINGIAFTPKYAANLRKLRVSSTGARLYPEIPLAVTNTGSLDGIPAAVSTTVGGAAGHDTGVLAFLGDFTTIKWRLAAPITVEVIPYGDPDNTGVDLAGSNQVAYRTEAVYSYAILNPDALAVLKPAADAGAGASTRKATR